MKTKYLAGIMLLAAGVLGFTSCSDDEDYSVATGNIISTVETGEAAVTATTATVTGRVLDLSSVVASSYSVGVVYSTNQDPLTGGRKQPGTIDEAGVVTATVSDLTKGVTYYYATYVTLQNKVTRYGEVRSFVTTDAQIATSAATDVTSVSAVLGGVATADPLIINVGSEETEYGFRLATTAEGVSEGREYTATSASRSFTQEVKGLLPGTTYYYATYFKMGDGYVYGDTQSFTTATKEMEYVDLGLSVMWAKYNIGAETESEAGALIGWGDLSGLNTSTYLADYNPAVDIAGTEFDVAMAISEAIDGAAKNKSHLPTVEQIEELINKTTMTADEVDGVAGYRFTGKNGNSIFLPAAGYREGETLSGTGVTANYWTGNVSDINADYGRTFAINAETAVTGLAKRTVGHAVRSVRAYDAVETMDVDISKVKVGDIENNGRIRIELYNEYGSTSGNPGFNMSQFTFDKNMVVTFKLSGVTGNLKDGAPTEYIAGLEFAAGGWDPSLWSDFTTKYDAKVTGDGEYTVWFETGGKHVEGAVVFCIDINELGSNVVDIDKVKCEAVSIAFDVEDGQMQYYIDNSKVLFSNKDGDGVNARIEIYNEYGPTKDMNVDVSDLSFSGYQIVTYTITGIDGNLVEGAEAAYQSELSYAAAGWWPSWWGTDDHQGIGSTTVTGDGTYTVFAPIDANLCSGAVVWTIELYDLWKDLADPSKVNVHIDSIVIPGKK